MKSMIESHVKIFISYSKKDSKKFRISEIVNSLKECEGIDDVLCFEEELYDNFVKYMNDGIGGCDVVVLFCSPNSLKSKNVEKEWTAADCLEKPIIPVFIKKHHIPPLLSSREGVEYNIHDFAHNIAEINRIIKKKTSFIFTQYEDEEIGSTKSQKSRLLEEDISDEIEKSILKDYITKIEWDKSSISLHGEELKIPDLFNISNLNNPIDLSQNPSDWINQWEYNWSQHLENEKFRDWYKSRLKLLMNGIRGLMYNSLSDSLIIVPPPDSYFQMIWNRLKKQKKVAVFGESGKGKSKFMLYLAAFWKKTYNGTVFLINNPNIMEERHWTLIENVLNVIEKDTLFIIDDFQNVSEDTQERIKGIVELREKGKQGKIWWLIGFTLQPQDLIMKSMTKKREKEMLVYGYWGYNFHETTLDKLWNKWKQFFIVWWGWLSKNFSFINQRLYEKIPWGKINAPWEITAALGGLNEKLDSYFKTHMIEKTIYLLCACLFLLNNEDVFGREELESLIIVGPQKIQEEIKRVTNQPEIKSALGSILNKWQQQSGENPWLLTRCIPTITEPHPISLPHRMLAIDLLEKLERDELYYLIRNHLGRVYKGLLPACELFEVNDEGGIISALSRLTIHQGRLNFDELIGIFIARKWNNYEILSSNEFIECIMEFSSISNYEFKRQIAEILPILFHLHLNGAKSIIRTLRRDFDDIEWKSDIRRRVIEALDVILEKEPVFIKEQIQIIEGDEIFTLIAIVELLNSWRKKVSRSEAEKMFKDFLADMKKLKYSNVDMSTLKDFWNLLDIINLNIGKGLEKVELMCYNNNNNLRICIARNLHFFYDEYPDKTLELMRYFLGDDQDKNVRRPIAKENSLKFLLSILPLEKYRDKVIELIWDLIKDNDSIIRITCFDYIEKILQIYEDLGIQIIRHIILHEKNQTLLERAKLWKYSLDIN